MSRLSPLRCAAAYLGFLAAFGALCAHARGQELAAACGEMSACPGEADPEDDATLLQLAPHPEPAAFVGDGCVADSLPPYMERPGQVLMTLSQAAPCIMMLEGPAPAAKETVHALALYFANFYAFAKIAVDPPSAQYTFGPEFDGVGLGIFGADGGGAPAEASKVDLITGLEELSKGIPDRNTTFPVVSWIAPVNELFIRLRDSHVGWQNTQTTQPSRSLSLMFTLALMDAAGFLVQLDVSTNPGHICVDGKGVPVVKFAGGSGIVVQSIGGVAPMKWLQANIAESSVFPYLYKSVGARMNDLVDQLRNGAKWSLGDLGSTASLEQGPIDVELKDQSGNEGRATWQWRVISNAGGSVPGCTTFACAVTSLKPSLQEPGNYASRIRAALEILKAGWKDLVPAPSAPPPEAEQAELEGPQPATRDAAQKASSDTPSSAMPQNVFAWLLKPTLQTDTYGFLAFRTGDDGVEHGVFKYTTFLLSREFGFPAPPGFDLMYDAGSRKRTLDMMRKEWSSFTAEAQRRGVTRLIVDGVGNGGGMTDSAWQFVQFMMPDLPFAHTCGTVSRPIPEAYKLWEDVDMVDLFEFQKMEGLQQDRFFQLQQDPAAMGRVMSNTIALLSVANQLQFFEQSEFDSLIKQLTEANHDLRNPDTAWSGFAKMFKALHGVWNNNNPFSNQEPVMEEAYRHPAMKMRGGSNRSFTTRMRDCPAETIGNLKNPFNDIVIISDGLCGSSCYLATGTTWAVAKKFGNRRVRFATFGGIGGSLDEAKKTLSATSFPGGNVMSTGASAVFQPVLKNLVVQSLIANFIGSESTIQGLLAVLTEMVSLVPYYSKQLPMFTQSQVYQPSFGPNSPPAEYVFVPTDLYIPYWFKKVSGTSPNDWDVPELEKMYAAAAQAFGK